MYIIIVTHQNPDLDACACVALAGVQPFQVHFLPAGAQSLPDRCACGAGLLPHDVTILDHPLGEKGSVDVVGVVHAAALGMAEAAEADPELLAEVEEQDTTGKVAHPRFSLARVLSAIRAEASERGLRAEELDREVVATMSRIIRGINLLYAQRAEAQKVIAKAAIVEIANFKLAVLPGGEVSPEVGISLNEEYDVSGAIYAQRHNLGVTRYPGRDAPDLTNLTQELPGWFIHSAGFLACWGSRKSPATTTPPKGTPQTQQELLELVQRIYG